MRMRATTRQHRSSLRGIAPRRATLSDTEQLVFALRLQSRGEKVVELQQLLTKVGYPVRVDGLFGEETQAAVKAFQQSYGGMLKTDGVVGNGTWFALHDKAGASSSSPVPPSSSSSSPSSPVPEITPVSPQAPSAGAPPQPQQQYDPVSVATPSTSQQQAQQSVSAPQRQAQQQQQASAGGSDSPWYQSVLNPIGSAAGNVINSAAQKYLGASATPPTVAGGGGAPTATTQQNANAGRTPMGASTPQNLQKKGEITIIETEAPYWTALRYAVPVLLGVGAGVLIHNAQDKPSTVLTTVGGAAVTVISFFAGNLLFPPYYQEITPENSLENSSPKQGA